MPAKLLREVIPLTQNDCFTIFSRVKHEFDFPLHSHDEFELNFIANACHAKRIIGDHMAEINSLELVLVGPNVPHGWFTHKCNNCEIHEITIQFHKDLLDEKMLRRNQLSFIKAMLEKSLRGVLFSQETTKLIMPRIRDLTKTEGFNSVLELMSILHDLSISGNMRVLSDSTFSVSNVLTYNSRRIETVMEYLNKNFDRVIPLAEASKIASMSQTAFSRFFKLRTGINFVDALNDIRLGHASRMLIETTNTIAEIAFTCGFNNISNFNRIFKRRKYCTPKEFRDTYTNSGVRSFI